MSFPDDVDLVIYINLDKRGDRRVEMEAELKRVGVPESKILRWPATLREGNHTTGSTLGCTLSHIGALSYVQTLPDSIQNVIILEDDFNFTDDTSLVKSSLEKILRYPSGSWDVVLLSYWVQRRQDYDDLVSIALHSHGTAGYMVNRQGLPRLLSILEESRDGLLRTGQQRYVIDVYWQNFMANRKCFYFNIPLGYQRESYSDIHHAVSRFDSRVG